MLTRPDVNGRLCFVMMPYHGAFDNCYEVVRRALADAELTPLRADEIDDPNSIQRNIWDSIWKAKLALADVSELNPNVNYEMGMCHALQVPVIIIARKGTKIPVDYSHIRYIAYDEQEPRWEDALASGIRNAARAILTGRYRAPFEWPKAALRARLFRQSNDSALPELLEFVATRPIKRATVIQYSSINNMNVIKELWKTDADIEIFIASGKGKYEFSKWQTSRVERFLHELPNELLNIAERGSKGKLEVFLYEAPGSVRAVLLDDSILTFGAYVYEKHGVTGRKKELDVRGAEKPLVLLRAGDPDFETVQTMVLRMIQNWKGEGVVKKPALVLKRGGRVGRV